MAFLKIGLKGAMREIFTLGAVNVWGVTGQGRGSGFCIKLGRGRLTHMRPTFRMAFVKRNNTSVVGNSLVNAD
jgi:hypothetical protein